MRDSTGSALRELVAKWRKDGADPRNIHWQQLAFGECADELESILTAAGDQQAAPAGMVHTLTVVELNALAGVSTQAEYEAGDVYDSAPSIEADEDAYWAYHTYHAIDKLLATTPPTMDEVFDQLGPAMRRQVRGEVGSAAQVAPTPLPMDSAPRDGRLVRLLVAFTDNAIEDSTDPVWTIGSNSFDNHGDEDEWKFAGWSWEQDCYTQGEGTPVGWLPWEVVAPAAQVAAPVQTGCCGRACWCWYESGVIVSSECRACGNKYAAAPAVVVDEAMRLRAAQGMWASAPRGASWEIVNPAIKEDWLQLADAALAAALKGDA